MRKKCLLQIVFIFFMSGCESQQNSSRLAEIDSLVSMAKYDSAYQEVLKMERDFDDDKEAQAHFYLLLTQTSLLTGHALTSDSLINIAISYYEKDGNNEKLSDAYYYKAQYLLQRKDYAQAIVLAKKGYNLAHKIDNNGEQYKIAKLISHINCVSGNYDLQLEYAKKSLSNAMKTKNDRWIAYAYNNMNAAYQYQGLIDSAVVYAEKAIPYLNSIDSEDLPYVLNSIGYTYITKDSQKAKTFFEKSISLKPMSSTLENLAYIYKKGGDDEKAYELWINALSCDDGIPVDKIIYHILQYNLSHGNFEGACEQLHHLVAIKDSLKMALADRSIRQIQQEYDEKIVSDRHEKEMLKWTVAALVLTMMVVFLIGYIKYKKYKSKIAFKEHQLLINDYINEVGRLKEIENTANSQIDNLNDIIRDYEEQIDKLNQVDNASKLETNFLKEKIEKLLEQINKLQAAHKDAELQITDLNQKINDLMDQESPKLAKGKLLYDQILQNGTTVKWTKDDYNCFIDFYKTTNFASYTKLIKEYSPKTAHNTFFLILYEMKKEDKEVRKIMGITQEAIRSTRFRIQKHLNK